jgi:protein-S-isoprenylcysteine O-methyltransferase Ste14
MNANANLAMVATGLVFAVTLLFVSSSPVEDLSIRWAIQGWYVFLLCSIAATLVLGGIFARLARATESKDVQK